MTAPEWPSGPLDPALARGEIHVWQASLDGWRTGQALARLTDAERARAAEIVRPSARSRWIVARASLRVILGRYLGIEEIALAVEPGGRPYLDDGPTFSVSHSRGLALYAVAANTPLGVDVELVRDEVPVAALRRRLAASDSSTPRQLLAQWTRREALLKCASPEPWTCAIDLGRDSVATLASAAPPSQVRLWTFDTHRESPHAERRGRPTGAPI